MQLYKVKLNENHTANPDQVAGEFLGNYSTIDIALYTRGEAIKKAKQFGGTIMPHGKKYTVNSLKMLRLAKQELSPAVLRELKEREVYTDPADETHEPIYYGDVFAGILGEHSEQTLLSFNQDVIDELIVLDNICANYEYVMVM